ncbi:SMI1/KNR4 family protein [Pseudomonas matsuisoli]|uniref:Cell wall assembly protein n=1 Tax=Pseudomonas matsuisoli TaxID=1515666 RepID=A0A917UXY5_9PSED|nr:SMI1/KNR4 family protein [Pseudomonas matsuisoli]GGJ94521.1 cell wall assembly protein [Pseudomonas matsuisoli]
MEDVIEQLRELNEPVPVPLELPDEDLLVEIEEELLINMPLELREFLLTVSDVIHGKLEPVTVTDSHSHTYLPEVAANAWDAGVPRDLVPICQDGRDYYVVDLENQVTLFDGDSGEMTDESWDSVWHWARDVWLES